MCGAWRGGAGVPNRWQGVHRPMHARSAQRRRMGMRKDGFLSATGGSLAGPSFCIAILFLNLDLEAVLPKTQFHHPRYGRQHGACFRLQPCPQPPCLPQRLRVTGAGSCAAADRVPTATGASAAAATAVAAAAAAPWRACLPPGPPGCTSFRAQPAKRGQPAGAQTVHSNL